MKYCTWLSRAEYSETGSQPIHLAAKVIKLLLRRVIILNNVGVSAP